MSFAPPTQIAEPSCTIIVALGSITIVSPAIAMNDAALAATPSMRMVTLPAWFLNRLWIAAPSKMSPPPELMCTSTSPAPTSAEATSLANTPSHQPPMRS